MSLPNFSYENRLWEEGFKFVAGVDEVGRGCFAGPIVAAACAFTLQIKSSKLKIQNEKVKINDSKKLTVKQRETASEWIKENAEGWGVGKSTVVEINRLGMAKATRMAFRRAVASANKRLDSRVDYLLIDAFFVPYIRGFPMARKKARKNRNLRDSRSRQLAIKNGDEKSISIAAASIIAKVYRDKLMEKVGSRRVYRKYDWVKNKGYATKVHQEAILKYGICGHHRKAFVETFLEKRMQE